MTMDKRYTGSAWQKKGGWETVRRETLTLEQDDKRRDAEHGVWRSQRSRPSPANICGGAREKSARRFFRRTRLSFANRPTVCIL